jgi:hypothetical protein
MPSELVSAPAAVEMIPLPEFARRRGVSLAHARRLVQQGHVKVTTAGTHANGRPCQLVLWQASPPGLLPACADAPPAALVLGGLPLAAAPLDWRLAELARRRPVVEQCLARIAGGTRPMRAYAGAAAEIGVSLGTLRGWCRAFKAGGLDALLPARNPRKGKSRIPLPLQAKIRAVKLTRMNWDDEQIMEHIVRPWCLERGVKPPHRKTVAALIAGTVRRFEEAAFCIGPKEFDAHFVPKLERDISGLRPGEVWSLDNRRGDNLVLDGDRPVRPWVTAAYDVASGAFVAMISSRQPSSDTVTAALCNGFVGFGLSERVQTDGGLDFIAKRIAAGGRRRAQDTTDAALSAEAETLLGALGVKVTRALPYRARSKPVESAFRAFFRRFENLLPGYCGRSTERRPEALKRQVKEGLLLTWQEYEGIVTEQLRLWNEEHVVGERTAPPMALYREHWKTCPPRIPPADELAVLAQRHERRQVTDRGVTLDNVQHEGTSPQFWVYVGCKGEVRWTRGGPAFITFSDGVTFALRPRAKGEWGEFGEAVADVAAGRRAQFTALAVRKRENEAAASVAELDPLDAFRPVADRVQQQRQAEAEARASAPPDYRKLPKGSDERRAAILAGAKATAEAQKAATERSPEDEAAEDLESALRLIDGEENATAEDKIAWAAECRAHPRRRTIYDLSDFMWERILPHLVEEG